MTLGKAVLRATQAKASFFHPPSCDSVARPQSWLFAAATLTGAFLVFQVQPVISKCVLPWFGGTPTVWTTCLLFFQVLLFAGYVYAHALRQWLPPRAQGLVHLLLLITAALMLPIQPHDSWKPHGDENPTWALLTLLTAHVALPYFALSSAGPLVQAWLSYEKRDLSIYRLYALSNLGSLAALLTYPFVVEPLLSINTQSVIWSVGFLVFAGVMGTLAIRLILLRGECAAMCSSPPNVGSTADARNRESDGIDRSHSGGWSEYVAWVGFPALASVMLLVVTSHVCQDVAVIPFLWVLPLSLYLVSFILSFDSPRWYRPKWIATGTALACLLVQSTAWLAHSVALPLEAAGYLTVLFGVCWLCHGETAHRRPSTDRLTLFYAMISFGGALGGLVVAVLCPLIFHDYRELPIAMSVSVGLTAVVWMSARSWTATSCQWARSKAATRTASVAVCLFLLVTLLTERSETIDRRRNFFGVLRVEANSNRVQLVHGNTIHGIQMRGEDHAVPTSYYGRQSGIGRVMAALRRRSGQRSDVGPGLRIGVVGLGCGVLATYGGDRDEFDLIEINSDVIAMAHQHFTFLEDCPSSLRLHLGDGRLCLERMEDRRFDLLIIDAFSSDAIPAHLLTKEAIDLYRSRLADRGVLAIHLSNNHLELMPLAHRLAAAGGLASREVKSGADPSTCTRPARWLIATDSADDLWADPALATARPPEPEVLRNAPYWTDQHHNLASVLNWF